MPGREQPKRGLTAEQELQAKDLEARLFGGGQAALDAFGSEAAPGAAGDGAGFWASPAEGDIAAVLEDRRGDREADVPARDAGKPRGGSKRRVWADPDDPLLVVPVAGQPRVRRLRETEEEREMTGDIYEQRLRQQHAKLNPRTAWATEPPKAAADEDEDDTLALGAERMLGDSAALPAGTIAITALADANAAEPTAGVVRSVEFHPGGQLLLTAGLDKRLRLFQVDGVNNPKVQSVFFDDMPVHRAAFADGGAQIVAAGRRRFFYVYHLASGRVERVARIQGMEEERSLETFAASPAQGSGPELAFLGNAGSVAMVSLRSRQLLFNLKMNGTARSAAFSPDGRDLLTMGGDGTVYTWDLRTRRCRDRTVDEGTVKGTALACGASMFATCSDSGAVNLHSRRPADAADTMDFGLDAALVEASGEPAAAGYARPVKSLLNLTTVVDSLAFSPDEQILAMASRMNKRALRLVHVPSRTVFANWPTPRTPLHYVHSLAFSPGGGYLAVGSAQGRALLYRLKHYPAA